MEQYDCPFITTSDDYDVTFSTYHWHFDTETNELETRMTVESGDPAELADGLRTLREHDTINRYRLLGKYGETAQIRTRIDQTDAMRSIRENDGYITGPFRIQDGTEIWNLGFDSQSAATHALGELDRRNEFEVVERDSITPSDQRRISPDRPALVDPVETCRELTSVERRTLRRAISMGYFDSPRSADLRAIADELGVSKPAVSQNLRRAQRKVLRPMYTVLEGLDSET